VRVSVLEAYYDLVKRLVKSFKVVKLDYVFTGALAASFYGVPRTTVDVDVMVEVSESEHLVKLVSALKMAGLSIDEREIDVAVESGYRIATFRDTKTSYSVDIIFSSKKLKKRAGTVAGLQTFYQTPEELVSAKLRMIKATVPRERALKDEEDVRAILKFTRVNVGTVKKQAGKDSTFSIFESLMG
jgi:hypothetical protein